MQTKFSDDEMVDLAAQMRIRHGREGAVAGSQLSDNPNYVGTNTAGLMPKNLPSLPAIVALIFRFPARIADRLL